MKDESESHSEEHIVVDNNPNKEPGVKREIVDGAVILLSVSPDGEVHTCLFKRDNRGQREYRRHWQIVAGRVKRKDTNLLETIRRKVEAETTVNLAEHPDIEIVPIGLLDQRKTKIIEQGPHHKLQTVAVVPWEKTHLFRWNDRPNPTTKLTEGQNVSWYPIDEVVKLPLTKGTQGTFSSPEAREALKNYARKGGELDPSLFGYEPLPQDFNLKDRGEVVQIPTNTNTKSIGVIVGFRDDKGEARVVVFQRDAGAPGGSQLSHQIIGGRRDTEKGETLRECALRKIKERCGAELAPNELHYIGLRHQKEKEGHLHKGYFIVFEENEETARAIYGFPEDGEGVALKYLTVDDIAAMQVNVEGGVTEGTRNLFRDYGEVIKQAILHKKFPSYKEMGFYDPKLVDPDIPYYTYNQLTEVSSKVYKRLATKGRIQLILNTEPLEIREFKGTGACMVIKFLQDKVKEKFVNMMEDFTETVQDAGLHVSVAGVSTDDYYPYEAHATLIDAKYPPPRDKTPVSAEDIKALQEDPEMEIIRRDLTGLRIVFDRVIIGPGGAVMLCASRYPSIIDNVIERLNNIFSKVGLERKHRDKILFSTIARIAPVVGSDGEKILPSEEQLLVYRRAVKVLQNELEKHPFVFTFQTPEPYLGAAWEHTIPRRKNQ